MPSTIHQVARDLTVFGNAVIGIYTVFYDGSKIEDPSADLPTKLYEDPVPVAALGSAETKRGNDQLRRALVNELSAWLAVSVRDRVKGSEIVAEPEYRFLKHVRNGIAHGNEFYFEHDISETIWEGNEITDDLCGDQVIGSVDSSSPFLAEANWTEGFLEAGDIWELCKDIMALLDEKQS